MKTKFIFTLLIVALFFGGCNEENPLPKPKALLRLEYERPVMEVANTVHFTFKYNTTAVLKAKKSGTALSIRYPKMNASIFMNYKEINNDLDKLITDAHKLSLEHASRADGITPRPYVDPKNKVYGAFFEVRGDAASQAQFYATDSLKHFVTGSLYFEARPNYDSIYPAAVYIQNDMGRIMETLRWKD